MATGSPALSHLLHADPSLPPLTRPPTTNPAAPTTSPNAAAAENSITYAASTVSPSGPSYGGSPSSNTSGTSPNAPGQAGASAPRSHASNASLYQCADCLRRYSRPEHLQRHIATHTLGKRFLCDVCGKAFGRADLLKRHRANHDDSDNGTKRRRINASPGAGRVAHACQACAKARVKCEESKPCTRCRNRNQTCEYASSEAGSAAAMHLLHLSANAHSTNATSAPMASSGQAGPASHNMNSESYQSHGGHSHTHSHISVQAQGLPTPAAPAMTNTIHAQPNDTTNNPSILPAHPPMKEEAQLPTPDTMMDHSNPDTYQAPYQQDHNMLDMARLPFSDFLRDVLFEQSQGHSMDPSRMVEAHGAHHGAHGQGLAVLDFCDDGNLELNDMDFGLLDHWNVGNGEAMLATDPSLSNYVPNNQVEDTADMSRMRQRLVKIWTHSPWRWMPDKQDSGYVEQNNLPLTQGEVSSTQLRLDRVIRDKLEAPGRDKILAIVLSTCRDNAMMGRVASSFPSNEVMDALVHIFLAWHLCQVSEWIHYGSFRLNAQCPEWLAVAASAGAILTPVATLRKFGFALQEAVRVTIISRFEDNNTKVQDIGLVQALVLGHDIGLWSGNRRKMEIAECHLNIPIAMIRGRGGFQRSSYPPIYVDPTDEGQVLDEKWKRWHAKESWKRLVFHLHLRDAQVSMTSLSNPHISYAELTLPLPEARELWFAKDAQEWKMHYLERAAGQTRAPPSLGDLLRDINLLAANHHRLDVQYSISIYLHGFWALIREYRNLNAVHRSLAFSPSTTGNPNLLLASRHQELVKTLEAFTLVTSGWQEMLSAQESVVLNILVMNLHVSLDDLQLFSGKEGDDQARRVYPTLQRWVDSPDARRALWHAGQILRHAKEFPPGHLKDFYAVAVHHAALCLWTHGVVSKATRGNAMPVGYETTYIDGPDSNNQVMHGFVGFGQGRAAIRGPPPRGGNSNGPMESYLEDPKACMDIVEEIFRANFLEGHLAPIVENLCHLIKQLGNAAWAVGLG